MSSSRSVLPALQPPSYPPVAMASASRLRAPAVVVPDDFSVESSRDKSEMSVLGRRSSMEGNVLCIDNARYFWLHRKIRTTATKGSVRVGFCLKDPALQTSREEAENVWEVMVTPPDQYNFDGDSRLQLVAIRIENSIDIIDSAELATLNFVASNSSNTNENIQNTLLLASDSSKIYIVMPYEDATSMTLLDYCLGQPGSILAENKAREYMQQILRGLESLQNMKLCHRNLTMDSIILRPVNKSTTTDQEYCCMIGQFNHAIRVPCSPDGTTTHMITSLPFIGTWNMQYVAPEIWIGPTSVDDESKNNSRPFDGYAVDLWSVGIMLLSMLFGNESIFIAPVLEDRIFQQICVRGQLSEFVKQHQHISISDNAIDLLQKMLRYDPIDRPTLAEVQHHPWVLMK